MNTQHNIAENMKNIKMKLFKNDMKEISIHKNKSYIINEN